MEKKVEKLIVVTTIIQETRVNSEVAKIPALRNFSGSAKIPAGLKCRQIWLKLRHVRHVYGMLQHITALLFSLLSAIICIIN